MNLLKTMIVIKHLHDLSAGKREPKDKNQGVCGEITLNNFYDVFQSNEFNFYASQWKYFSGDIVYPISNLEEKVLSAKWRQRESSVLESSSAMMYHDAKELGQLWHTSKNAERRREFCEYLSFELSQKLFNDIYNFWKNKNYPVSENGALVFADFLFSFRGSIKTMTDKTEEIHLEEFLKQFGIEDFAS